MPRLTRSERRELTRSKIIEAAGVCIARRGFEAVSVDEITDEAGFSRGAFYSNFESKDDLFKVLMNNSFETELSILATSTTKANTVEELCDLMEKRYREHGDSIVWCLLLGEAQLYVVRARPKFKEFMRIFANYQSAKAKLLAAFYERLELSPKLSPFELGVSLTAIIYGTAVQRKANPKIDVGLTGRLLESFMQGVSSD